MYVTDPHGVFGVGDLNGGGGGERQQQRGGDCRAHRGRVVRARTCCAAAKTTSQTRTMDATNGRGCDTQEGTLPPQSVRSGAVVRTNNEFFF